MANDAERDEPEGVPTFSNFLSPFSEVEATERYLPHWQWNGGVYFVTWRLADAISQTLLRQWAEDRRIWLEQHPKPWDATTRVEYQRSFPRRLESWLDSGYGSCLLRNPACSGIAAKVMRKFDGERYDIASFVIMPNHVHALFQLRGQTKIHPLLKAWKGTSAREINKHLGRQGTLWLDESRDTSIRSQDHLVRSYLYARRNPELAGLQAGEYHYYEMPGIDRRIRQLSGDFDE